MKTNAEGRQIIVDSEGYYVSAYKCPAGVWTIGIGATGPGIVKGLVWTPEQIWDRFEKDLARFEKEVSRLVFVELNENQFSALVSFVFNMGAARFARSTLLRMLNAGSYLDAAAQFDRWDNVCDEKGCRELPGLHARRLKEQTLFLAPVQARTVA